MWNVRALDAAGALSDDRAQEFHADLRAAGFYPSLHMNLAEDFRRLGSFGAADTQLRRARDRLDASPDGPYGQMIRDGLARVGQAVAARDRT